MNSTTISVTAVAEAISEISSKTFADQINDVILDMGARLTRGMIIDPKEVAIFVDHREDNAALRSFVIQNKIMSPRDFDKLVRTHRVVSDLGAMPKDPSEYINIIVAKRQLSVTFGGAISQKIPTDIQADLDTIADEAERDYYLRNVRAEYPPHITRSRLETELRSKRDILGLSFENKQISDAVQIWLDRAIAKRLLELGERVGLNPVVTKDREAAEPVWRKLVERNFDLSEMSADLVIAVLKKFVWQVKRKLTQKPVTNHLMPVLLGAQGGGKSTLVESFYSPLKELAKDSNFSQIQDDRIIDIWHHYIIFMDEMGGASKSEIDLIKNIITTDTLERRPMGQNGLDTIRQCATFIGCSNRELSQLITDTTGIRRFIGLRFSNNPCWDTVNQTDYLQLWRSVDVTQADPTIPFMAEIKALQEGARRKSSVEEWAISFDSITVKAGDVLAAARLFELYSGWEATAFPNQRMNLTNFKDELKRLSDNTPDAIPFKKHRSATVRGYRYEPSNVIPLPTPRLLAGEG